MRKAMTQERTKRAKAAQLIRITPPSLRPLNTVRQRANANSNSDPIEKLFERQNTERRLLLESQRRAPRPQVSPLMSLQTRQRNLSVFQRRHEQALAEQQHTHHQQVLSAHSRQNEDLKRKFGVQ